MLKLKFIAKNEGYFSYKVHGNNFSNNLFCVKWDSRREDKGKHEKFDNLWIGPFHVSTVQDNKTYTLAHIDHNL